MGWFKKLIGIWQAKRSLPEDKVEAMDPERKLNLFLEKAAARLAEFNLEINRQVHSEMNLRQKIKALEEEIESWQKQAKAAVAKNRDDLARLALERKAFAEGTLAELKEQLARQQKVLCEMREGYRLLEKKLAQVKDQRDELILRLRRAEARQAASEAIESLEVGPGLSQLERLIDKVIDLEAQAEASELLATSSLETELARSRIKAAYQSVEEELGQLKAGKGEAN